MSWTTIRKLGLRDQAKHIIKDVTFTVPLGRITALLGAPGSGKTPLLRAIAGLEAPHTGSIRIGEETAFDATAGIDIPVERRGIGFMFQSAALWPHWTIAESLAFCARAADKASANARVGEVLGEVSILGLAQCRPSQLSATERQRVALARALVARPRLLLLDDPLGGLISEERTAARQWLRAFIARTGTTTLLATSDRTDALALADHTVLLNAGAVEQEGTPHDLYTQPATSFAAAFMGANNRISGMLVEKAGPRAFIDVVGTRIGGVARTQAALGEPATGMIRTERVLIGGGPGTNRLAMTLQAQAYLGERWELTFEKEGLTVRAHASTPLRHEHYHVEFPPDALWIF